MIYLDNASTSFPKAPCAGEAMARYMRKTGVNVARGGYELALEAVDTVLTLRERLCAAFGGECAEGCVLTSGATFGLNMALKGYLRPGDHVLVSAMEHNAVMRPLAQLAQADVEIGRIPCAPDGTLDPADARRLIGPRTRLVCVTHASNVCGTLLPVAQLGALCRELGVPLLVDASQTAGHIPIDCKAMGIDALIFSAHKGLLGPQGIGAALFSRAFAGSLSPFVTGGTGSRSDREEQPSFLPDKLEAGTPNLPGVYGFLAALDFWEPHAEEIRAHESELCKRFLAGLEGASGIRVVGTHRAEHRVAVVSVDFTRQDNADMALTLEKEHGILTRCGLHCAPAAHRTLGTFPEGTVRFSFGWANTREDVDAAVHAVRRLGTKYPCS